MTLIDVAFIWSSNCYVPVNLVMSEEPPTRTRSQTRIKVAKTKTAITGTGKPQPGQDSGGPGGRLQGPLAGPTQGCHWQPEGATEAGT